MGAQETCWNTSIPCTPALQGSRTDRLPNATAPVGFPSGEVVLVRRRPMQMAGSYTWAFVMAPAFSRHQHVGRVWDQTVATWRDGPS